MKKILIYNWSRVDDKRGGGVTVYVQNLINALIKSGEYEVTHLNSGWTYDNKKKPYIKKIENNFNSALDCYELINSPVLAPIEQCAKNLKVYLEDKSLRPIISEFIRQQHGFDVIHFNNLEGISLDVLRLKESFPETKIIYSMHNYFPFCSRVNLWQNDKSDNPHNCDKISYEACIKCYEKKEYYTTVSKRRKNTIFTKVISRLADTLYRESRDFTAYQSFTEENIKGINKYVDLVLAVSKRVEEISAGYGISKEKLRVSYIGTKVADRALYECNAKYDGKLLNIAYMGYMRQDKGYYFLVSCLEQMPDECAKRINATFAARYDDNKYNKEVERLNRLKTKCNSITLLNGYTADTQPEILQGINLGIVPVLWEDNLPQVAIEQIAYGVPILVSDLGGAKELCADSRFVFKAGDTDDFINKLIDIMDHPNYLEEYWDNVMKLTTIDMHFNEIKSFYS